MSQGLIATATTSINAGRSAVWQALITPEAIKQYMFGTDVHSNWQVGNDITWSGEFHGRRYEDKGKILRFEPETTLAYTHFSAMSGQPDRPENYHTVEIRLSGNGDITGVALSQDNNPDEKSRMESEKNWNTILDGLKKYIERD
jgi:uncharacterized protein YndB with AHSA1/START domain